nr:MAG TPA: hypothetical protein [Caudoviricetes sp.]
MLFHPKIHKRNKNNALFYDTNYNRHNIYYFCLF